MVNNNTEVLFSALDYCLQPEALKQHRNHPFFMFFTKNSDPVETEIRATEQGNIFLSHLLMLQF